VRSPDHVPGRSQADPACSVDELRRRNAQLRRKLAAIEEVEPQIVQLNREVEDNQREIIFRLAEIVEVRSRETGGHVMRVAELSNLLAVKSGFGRREAELLRAAAPMHDIGKVGIPDAILFNPGRLSAREFEVMKTHTTLGYEMLKDSNRPVLASAATIALQHHEKYNGTGYPLGLAARQIHTFARIVAIADVFDALSSDRVYRRAWDMERILAYFERQRGESFDPDLLDLFLEDFDDFLAIRHSFSTPGSRPATDHRTPDPTTTGYEPPGFPAMIQQDSRPVASAPPPHAGQAPCPSGPRDLRESQPIARILIADDDDVSRSVLEATLDTWGYDVTVCRSQDEARTAMQQAEHPNLAVVSHTVDDRGGLDICGMIRRREEQYVYIIVLAEAGHSDRTSEVISAGADACLHKPLREHELRARLSAAERIVGLQDQLLATQRCLQSQASQDALTGLWNRRAILKILRQELDRAKREDISVAVIMADLDRFKAINDTYGHQAGDIVLREAAQRMRSITRPYDLVGRYGGEEFIIIVPRCDSTFAAYVADRIRLAIADRPISLDGHEVPLTISLGVAALRGAEDNDSDALIKAADAALYEAKHEGRNRVCVAELAPLGV